MGPSVLQVVMFLLGCPFSSHVCFVGLVHFVCMQTHVFVSMRPADPLSLKAICSSVQRTPSRLGLEDSSGFRITDSAINIEAGWVWNPKSSVLFMLGWIEAIIGANAWMLLLTRSLPRDVYIRRQNDHPGGQGRIYTSHLNFVSTHLSKPGHRRGCCCMSPRCLLRQFVDRCLLFWAFFIEKTVLLCFARFLSKWRETALWMFPDATSWYELYVWWLLLRRRSRRELVSSCWKRGLRMTVDICWEKKLGTGAPGGKWPHFCCERRPRRFKSQWTLA